MGAGAAALLVPLSELSKQPTSSDGIYAFGRTLSVKQHGFTPWHQVLVLALWFGLLTGFGEVCLLGIKKLYLHQFVRVGPEILWMSALADALLFMAMGALLRPVARWWGNGVWCGALAFLACLSWLMMYYPIQMYAKVLLAGGVGLQAARLTSRHWVGFERFVSRSVAVMGGLVLLLGMGVAGRQWMQHRQAVAKMPDARAGAPNVLLIVADTVRARNLGLYGYQRDTTPNLERWAKTGVVFDRAVATSSWTLPSHAGMFTARWPHELSTGWESPLDDRYPTLAEILTRKGYLTAGFVANTYYCGYELGLARGFAHYEDYVVSPRELLVSSSLARSVLNSATVRRMTGYYDNIPRRSAADINDQFLNWVSGVHERPFFAFLNYFDAHETYLPPAPFDTKFGPVEPRSNGRLAQELRRSLRNDWKDRPSQEIDLEMNAYDGSLAYIDAQLDKLFTELRRRGLLEHTVVIVTADHGEQFGEHGLFLHANSLYEPVLHVPLVIWAPGRIPQMTRVPDRISLRDLPATVLDLVGGEDSHDLPGHSLVRYWSGSSGEPDDAVLAEVGYAEWAREWFPSYPTAKGAMQSLLDGDYHYIRNGDGREELYALNDDPEERHDLSQRDESRERLERFRAELKRLESP